MAELGLGSYKNINAFVEAKLKAYSETDKGFSSLFEMCFSEKSNVMYERSEGYRIIKTTYGEAYNGVLKTASALSARLSGAIYNSVVGIYMENSLEWIECFWAVIACGFRPLLLNLRLDDSTLNQALADCKAFAVISDGKQFSVPTIKANELANGADGFKPDKFGTEILLMSSGTSSHVKVCAYSAEELYYQVLDSYEIIKECKAMKTHYKGHLKLLTFLPFYHVFGLIAVYMWFAFFSRTFVQLNDMAPQTIVGTIKRHKVTHIFAVPMFWEKVYEEAIKTIKGRGEKTYAKFLRGMKLADRIGDVPLLGRIFSRLAFKEVRQNLFGESISFMITGGSGIGNNVLSFFNNIGYRLANGYGMTEIGITSVELSSKKRLLNGGFVGKPMSFVEYKINNEGELLVRGKVIARYVIKDGAVIANDDWFNTKDLAECKNGHYLILGRRDDVVISSAGENVNPNLLEPHFKDIAGVDGVCIIGGKQNGETVPILLVSINKHTTKERFEQIDAEVKERINAINAAQLLRKVVYVTALLIQGQEFKLNRTRIRADYENGSFPVYDYNAEIDVSNGDELFEQIRQLFALALDKPVSDIGADADFFLDHGGTSLDYFAMVSKMQEEFGVPFPTAGGNSLNTVNGIYEFIKAEKGNAY